MWISTGALQIDVIIAALLAQRGLASAAVAQRGLASAAPIVAGLAGAALTLPRQMRQAIRLESDEPMWFLSSSEMVMEDAS